MAPVFAYPVTPLTPGLPAPVDKERGMQPATRVIEIHPKGNPNWMEWAEFEGGMRPEYRAELPAQWVLRRKIARKADLARQIPRSEHFLMEGWHKENRLEQLKWAHLLCRTGPV